jgi:hypothetical protein
MKSFVTQLTALTNLIPNPMAAKPRNPAWLDEINSECASALREIQGNLLFLIEAKEAQNLQYFSRKAFQNRIDINSFIEHEKKLNAEKLYIESILANAQKIWDEKKSENPPEGIQRVNKHHHSLVLDGQQMGLTFFEMAKKLESEAKEIFERIDFDAKQLLQNLDNVGADANGTLKIACAEYKKAKDSYKNVRDPKFLAQKIKPSPNNKFSVEEEKKIIFRQAGNLKVETFKQLQQAYALANDFSNNFPANKKAILDRYAEAEKKYDVSYSKERYAFSNIAYDKMRSLTKAINEAKPLILDVHYVENERLKLLFDKVVDLLKNAVSNTAFWNRQVSCFGSTSKINRISVPIGVSSIYHTIQSQNFDSDSRETLTRIIKAAALRDSVGTGFFAKRNTNTTDWFYKIIRNIDMNNFSMRSFIELQSQLRDIQDDSGALVSLPGPEYVKRKR